jgi:hypothetical protein
MGVASQKGMNFNSKTGKMLKAYAGRCPTEQNVYSMLVQTQAFFCHADFRYEQKDF